MLEWIISSAVLTAIVIALRCIFKGKISLRVQYALWALVLLRLLVPVTFGSTGFSVMNLIDRPAAAAPSLSSATVGYAGEETPYIVVVAPDANTDPVQQNERYTITISGLTWQIEPNTAAVKTGTPITVSDILMIVWIAGAGMIALWFLITNLRFYFKLRHSRKALEIGGCPLPVYTSDQIDTPCLFGLIRPAIYVTPELSDRFPVLRYAIEHEATHYRHGDHIWSVLRGVCLALHWYNPLVWLAAVLSRNDAELACDEATIKRIGEENRAEYGRTLIELTCEKRPAIFVTATTMTGSGRNIKERIRLIVKKPRTAAYTLIALLLIAAITVGCTFTGANEENTEQGSQPSESETSMEPDETADEYPDDWFAGEAWPLAKEYAEKIGLSISEDRYTVYRNMEEMQEIGLYISDNHSTVSNRTKEKTVDVVFSDSDGIKSIQVSFVQTADGNWEALSNDAVMLIDGGSLKDKIRVSDEITEGERSEFLAPVIDFARDYVAQSIAMWNTNTGNPIADAEITGITQMNTGTASLYHTINLYLLEYRLLPEDQRNIKLADGMQTELIGGQKWITEHSSSGQPYLLLLRSTTDEWMRIGTLDSATIEQDYGTPEMLEWYGNAYTAAAMQMYHDFDAKGAIHPTVSIRSLAESGDISLTLYLADEGAWNTYTSDGQYFSASVHNALCALNWTRVEAPSTEPSDYWLTAVSADGTKSMTFRADSGWGTVEYSDGNTVSVWSAEAPSLDYEYYCPIADSVRRLYDGMDADYERISFHFDGTPTEAAYFFVNTAFGEHMHTLEPGNGYGADDYEVTRWSVRKISEDGKTVEGGFECAFVPWNAESGEIWAGNTYEGTDQYAGKLIFYRTFALELQDDGNWHCIGLGTG
ncbi:MAG: hypothetical protein CW335_04270 [Clostridiales bacterium]|nr:hypothetical protein [Clostridiales bacterium]